MVSVILTDCTMARETMTLLAASEKAAATLVRAIESRTSELLELPALSS